MTLYCTAPELLHRYSFNTGDASDSNGGSAWNGLTSDVSFVGNSAVIGSNGYISLPGGCFESSTTVSLEMWVSTDPVTAGSYCQRLLAFGEPFNSHNTLLGACDETATYVHIEGKDDAVSFTNLYGQTGQHIVLVASNAAELKIYVNGNLTAVSADVYPLSSDSTFIIGAALDTTQPLRGSIDEFRIWKGALSQQLIRDNFLAGPDGNLPGSPQATPVMAPTAAPTGK